VDSAVPSLVKGGFYLFLDLLVTSFSGLAFWFILTKLTTPSEIGLATTVISLSGLVIGIFGLGLEFPILKGVAAGKLWCFGTPLLFEMFLLALISPLVYIIGLQIYGSTFSSFMILGIALLLVSGLGFVTRHSAIAIFQTKRVFIFDLIATISKFAVGVGLVAWGLGGIGIVTALIIHATVFSVPLLIVCTRKIGIKNGGWTNLAGMLRMGISNMPGRMSSLVIGPLSVVLLASLGTDPEDVGIFFLALAVSLVGGGFGITLARLVLPVSSAKRTDITLSSIRIGLFATVPVIVVLMIAPDRILSLLGPAYVAGSDLLRILALAILPNILIVNLISRLNHLNKMREVIFLGVIQALSFLILFPLLVSQQGPVGASWAVLISQVIAITATARWLPPGYLKPVGASILALGLGLAPSFLPIPFLPSLVLSITLAIIPFLITKQMTFKEIKSILRFVLQDRT